MYLLRCVRQAYWDGLTEKHVFVPSVSVDRLAKSDRIDSQQALREYTAAAIGQMIDNPHTKVYETKQAVVDHLAKALDSYVGVSYILPGSEDVTFLLGGRTYQVSIKQLNK